MASINSLADIIRDIEGLDEAAERSPELVQGAEKEREALKLALVDIKSLKARQEELTALRQEATQQLTSAVVVGKEAARRLRAMAKAKFGSRSERLVHFNVVPLRKRQRAPVVVVKTPDGEVSGTRPGASASPPAKTVD